MGQLFGALLGLKQLNFLFGNAPSSDDPKPQDTPLDPPLLDIPDNNTAEISSTESTIPIYTPVSGSKDHAAYGKSSVLI